MFTFLPAFLAPNNSQSRPVANGGPKRIRRGQLWHWKLKRGISLGNLGERELRPRPDAWERRVALPPQSHAPKHVKTCFAKRDPWFFCLTHLIAAVAVFSLKNRFYVVVR